MCNCSKTSLCSRCTSGQLCGCPPDYTVPVLPVDCGCCPSGYVWSGPTLNYPNGVCTGPGGVTTDPIDCNPCVDSVPASCVILPSIPCFGIAAGTTLLSFIQNFMCSDMFWMNFINRLTTSTTLQAAMCSVMSSCPPAGSSTPIIGPITPSAP